MFHPGSRYAKQRTYTIRTKEGEASVLDLPVPRATEPRGFHRRTEGQRLDLIANYYLADPTAFHRLCDASQVMSPDALGERDLVAIPRKRG